MLDKLNEAKKSSACVKYEKAIKAIEESITLLEKRIKVIKLADRSEFGWSSVKVYLSDDLAFNFEEVKRIFLYEGCAERHSKQAAYNCRKA